MWQRKSPEEIATSEKKKRENPLPPVVVGVVGAILFVIYERSISGFIIAFICFGVLSYVGQIFTGNPLLLPLDFSGGSVRTVICNTCHRTKTEDKARLCECGGTFEPFENWRWVKD
jgi:hypothetical protein